MDPKKYILFFLFLAPILPLLAACSKDNTTPDPDPDPVWVHQPGASKVLIIGIDGCLNAAITPELMPNLYQLTGTSWYSANALALPPTWSCTGWASVLTGTSPDKHHYLLNEWTEAQTNLQTYPAFFKYVKAQKPGWKTASIVAWNVLHNFLIKQDMVINRYSNADDGAVENKVKEELAAKDAPEITFVHFDGVDHIGHDASPGGGFHIDSAKYRVAVKTADDRVGRLVAAVKNRPDYQRERWMILVVTDHGGIGTSHGGSSYREMNAFIVLNAPGILPTLVNTPPTITPKPVEADNQGNVIYKNGVYATLPLLSELNFDADKNFTIEMDVRLDVVNTEDPSFFGNKDWNSGMNPGITFVSRNNGQLMINVADGTHRVDLRYDNVLADQQWHRISFAYNRTSGQVTVYIDGVQRNYSSINGDLNTFAIMGSLTSVYPFRIAQDGTGSYGSAFNGGVKELRIFSGVALDPSTIVAYHSKLLDMAHPAIADLVIYNPGLFNLTTLSGGLGKPNLALTTGMQYDYHNAPYLYDIAPTIFKFLGLEIRPEYKWDGKPLVTF